MNENDPTSKIYLTYKTRMFAEAKFRQTGRWANNLITWYSFWLIIISLSEMIDVYRFYQSDFIFTACSIALFGLSLFVSGERYFEKADQFRNCYLEMQALYDSSLATKAKMKRYAEIRNKYENQTDDDYDDMLFDSWLRKQKLYNSEGAVEFTWPKGAMVVARRMVRYGFFLALLIFPMTALFFGERVTVENLHKGQKPSVVIVNGS